MGCGWKFCFISAEKGADGGENKSVILNQLVFITHQGYTREVGVVHQVKVGDGKVWLEVISS